MPDIAKTFADALAALNGRDLKRAEELFKRVIEADNANVPALNLLVVVLMSLGRFAEAEPFIARATALNRTSDVSFYNYGLICKRLNKPREALENFSRALSLNPNVAETWNNRGTVFNDLANYELALADFDKAIALNGGYAEAYANRGKSLSLLKRYDDALAAYDKALSIKPDLAQAWLGRGNASADLKRHDDALAAYDKARSIKPDLAEAWLGRGNVFYALKRHDEALAAYDKALSIKPDLEIAWLGRGNIFYGLKRGEDAFAAYDKALAIAPDLAEAWLGRGNLFYHLKRYDEAFAAYDRAFAIKPELDGLEGLCLHAKMHLCQWDNLADEIAHLRSAVRAGKPASDPFFALSLLDAPQEQRQCADTWVRMRAGALAHRSAGAGPNRSGKIRIGYLSADLRTHPVGYLTAGLFEQHDRDRFETYAFSIGQSDNSDLRRRIEKSFDKFLDLNECSDDDIARAIASAEIDILVDLAGHTQGARFGILARRPAPVLVHYLGFAGTIGGNLVDYIVADKTVVPDADRQYFSEHVISLPNCLLPHDDQGRTLSGRAFTRQEQNLPDEGFVFCCFNNAYKLTPQRFKSWMTILGQVDGSVLWLSGLNGVAKNNLRSEAAGCGIAPGRLVFAEHVASPADHLARHRLAGLFLDTLPYNAHTTASDALWAGLPVLTQIGGTFAGRVAASLLNAIGLPELITHSAEQYEARAIALALNPQELHGIRDKLEKNRRTTALFDTPLYARHLEAAYEAVYRRYRAGLPPDHIAIEA